MAFKFVVLFFACSAVASAAFIPVNNNGGTDLMQKQQQTYIDNQSNNIEQLRRQDEYLRNIDRSSDSFQNAFSRQQSDRLRDNEYRRTNWLWANNQNNRNIWQNQQQEQWSHSGNNWGSYPQNQQQRYWSDWSVAQASNYPRSWSGRSWNGPYNSRVSFSSPLVSYHY